MPPAPPPGLEVWLGAQWPQADGEGAAAVANLDFTTSTPRHASSLPHGVSPSIRRPHSRRCRRRSAHPPHCRCRRHHRRRRPCRCLHRVKIKTPAAVFRLSPHCRRCRRCQRHHRQRLKTTVAVSHYPPLPLPSLRPTLASLLRWRGRLSSPGEVPTLKCRAFCLPLFATCCPSLQGVGSGCKMNGLGFKV